MSPRRQPATAAAAPIKPPDPQRIERADDADVQLEARRRVRRMFSERQGRESTDLTRPADASYTRTALG